MTDWTTACVVRDRDGDLWFRGCDSDSMWTANTDYPDDFLTSDEVVEAFGPLVPVLDADGLPVVRTVGDLTARHVGRRVRVTVAGIETTGKLTRLFASDARPVSLHVDDVTAEVLWIVGPELGLTLDTPCELLP